MLKGMNRLVVTGTPLCRDGTGVPCMVEAIMKQPTTGSLTPCGIEGLRTGMQIQWMLLTQCMAKQQGQQTWIGLLQPRLFGKRGQAGICRSGEVLTGEGLLQQVKLAICCKSTSCVAVSGVMGVLCENKSALISKQRVCDPLAQCTGLLGLLWGQGTGGHMEAVAAQIETDELFALAHPTGWIGLQ